MIQHEGIIQKIEGNHITVRISQLAACSDCHAKSACLAAESKEKIVDIFDSSGQFTLNEQVYLEGKTAVGYKAVLWAFVIPLLLLIGTLLTTVAIWSFNEIHAALSALLVLIPYYSVLHLFRNKMAEKFTFKLRKLN